MSGDYLWDRSGPRDPEVERLERTLATLAQSDPPPPMRAPVKPPVTRGPLMMWLSIAAAVVLVAGAGLWWLSRPAPPGFAVTRLMGAPSIESRPMADTGELGVGHWLDTGNDGRVNIDIGGAGRVNVEPHSRVGLVSSQAGNYRLNLERGMLHAMIWAPPGQFAIDTPSSTTIDLGCSYTLIIDDEGVGTVRVSTGWVGFQWHGRESFIPEGAMCVTRPGLGPGTPYYEDAPRKLKSAVEMIDVGAGPPAERRAALGAALTAAREDDTVTLWHLLTRVDVADRDRVFDALAKFVPPPATVTKDGIRAGNREMLDAWWDKLGLGTASWWRIWRQDWKGK